MGYQYYLYDLEGTLYRQDNAIIEFKIQDRKLVYEKVINPDLLPYDLYNFGVSYHTFNEFFKHRVVLDGSQDIRDYLDCCGLKHYDFEEIVKLNNGWNHLDYYWVKFDGLGATCWKDILSQKYPIY